MSPPKETLTAGQLWLISMGGVLVLAGAVFTGGLWWAWQRAEETRQWVATPCVILSSRVVPVRKTHSANVTFECQVRYSYTVEGKDYAGTQIKRVDGPSSDPAKAEVLRQQFSPGQRMECFVKPGEPGVAILLHGSRAALYAIWFPLLFVVGGGVMAWRASRLRRAHA